jgi:hypothetical protein
LISLSSEPWQCISARAPYQGTSVSRLGEFSPIGCVFTLSSFLRNYKSSQHFWATLSHSEGSALIITKNGLGNISGD